MRLIYKLILIPVILVLAGLILAARMPASYVVDSAGIIENSIRQRLAGNLQELEQKTGVQMVILTVDSTEGIPIEEFALEKAAQWGLGQKEKDNGLIVVVAVNDRKYRIETGYGLESILPDSLSGSIARKYLVPRFKTGDYTGGIYATAIVIMHTIAKAEGVELTGLPKIQPRRTRSASPLGSLLTLVIIFIIISSLFNPRSRGLVGMLLLGTLLGSSWSGGSRGSGGLGSFGGGGFGSFGGGGGAFGGGGVSGGW